MDLTTDTMGPTTDTMGTAAKQGLDRRRFVTMTGAASGLLLVNAKTAFGYEANSAVRLGLLGCGGRGTAVASSFAKNTTARIVALADVFPDQMATARTHFDELNGTLGKPPIDPRLMFHGPDAYQELAHTQGIDMVQISTPPWFHVEHLAAAVAGGKHVYCEKPVGVDVAQARRAMEIARLADGKVSIDVGFQVRSAPPIAAILERVKAGAIGQIASIAANYNAPAAKEHVPPGASPDEHRLRNWLWDRALSGDILVEQNIHIIDLCNLALGAHPLKASATGGRTIIHHAGNCWDNYQVDYTYPGAQGTEVHVSFSSTQFGDHGGFDAGLSLFGAEGRAEAPYFQEPSRSQEPSPGPGRSRMQEPRPPQPAGDLPPTANSTTTSPLPIARRTAASSKASPPAASITRSPPAWRQRKAACSAAWPA